MDEIRWNHMRLRIGFGHIRPFVTGTSSLSNCWKWLAWKSRAIDMNELADTWERCESLANNIIFAGLRLPINFTYEKEIHCNPGYLWICGSSSIGSLAGTKISSGSVMVHHFRSCSRGLLSIRPSSEIQWGTFIYKNHWGRDPNIIELETPQSIRLPTEWTKS